MLAKDQLLQNFNKINRIDTSETPLTALNKFGGVTRRRYPLFISNPPSPNKTLYLLAFN